MKIIKNRADTNKEFAISNRGKQVLYKNGDIGYIAGCWSSEKDEPFNKSSILIGFIKRRVNDDYWRMDPSRKKRRNDIVFNDYLFYFYDNNWELYERDY